MENFLKKAAALLLLVPAAWACEPEPEFFEIFTIRQGDHYCQNRHPESLQIETLRFRARFDSSAVYTFDDAGFQDSKNKLLGFSDCNSAHHENSARFAWQWYNNAIEIYAYCYVQGQRVEQYLGKVNINETQNYRLDLTANAYIFYFRENQVVIERGSTCQKGLYMMLWPYFGGQIPAPHTVTIAIDRF